MLISIVITLLAGLIYFYFSLPAINLHAPEFYTFILVLCIVYCVCSLIGTIVTGYKFADIKEAFKHLLKKCAVPVICVVLLFAVAIIGNVSGCILFRAKDYAALLQIEQGDFVSEVQEVSWEQIPKLDADSASTLANKKMGELSDLVSQFEVNENTYQINYQDRPVRATYLDYGDFIKWFKNRKEGIPAYLLIDMVTQEVTVKRLEEGMKYSTSDLFNRNIYRYLRLCYPTKMFYAVNFEVDEEGTPYWCASVVSRTIGLFGGNDIVGAVLVNAVTGEHVYYALEDVPTWVDRVCNADLLMAQYDCHGLYQGGFWNSAFGQTDCTVSTSGYNYIAMDDDVWMYTGITSVAGDESNLGFILVNQRTKEARYYPCAGANEEAGMRSAQGAVQQYSYTATFPILLNVGGEPTYFMALKDASQLVKMYAMVNVSQYQLVATGTTVEECQVAYAELMVKNGIAEAETGSELVTETISGRIADIRSSVMDGDTWYFIQLEGKAVYYMINGREYPIAAILNEDDVVTITYEAGTEELIKGVSLERKL